jgi:AmmeMemoRadiSam system protein B/AmmeMemoRadiSam system protein A
MSLMANADSAEKRSMASGSKFRGQKTVNRGQIFLFFLSSVFCLLFSVCCFAENVKQPNVAGAFYPAEKSELSAMIQKYIRQAGSAPIVGEPVVLIAPHAGYIYSGPVAAYGYAALAGKAYDCVIILAASHYFSFEGVSVYKDGFFRTPLGNLEVDKELASELLVSDPKLLAFEPKYFENEHSLEVELPFLQEVLKPGFKILPVLLGSMSYEDCVVLSRYLSRITEGRSILVVVSTDLSHYRSYGEAIVYDKKTIEYIQDFDSKGLWDAAAGTGWNVCGIRPVVAGLEFARLKNARRIEVLKYANSGDTAGGKDKVVGYASVLITRGGGMFTKDEQKRLLEIARKTIEGHVLDKSVPVFKEGAAALNAHRGAFVTLRKNGELRGCIGQFTSEEPLYQVVSQMSVESSTHDYRFSPVGPGELKDIVIEVSVLSEPKLIDDWRKIRLGTDGVIIRKGFSSGVFLPQVATETGWDLETFLGQLCSQKAGLPWDCFKDAATKIYTFQAEIFSEDGE